MIDPSDAGQLFGYFFAIGLDVLSTQFNATSKMVLAQLGDSVNGIVDSDNAELWQTWGFVSRPAKPTKGQSSAQAIAIKSGDRDCVIAGRDTRSAQLYGNLKDGETCVFAATGQARTLYKANGTIVQYCTSDNTPGGLSCSESLGPAGWSVINQFGSISMDTNGITLTVGTASVTLTAAGILKLMALQLSAQAQGPAVLSGGLGTFLGPKSTFLPAQAALYGTSGPAAVPSTNVFLSV